MRRYLFASVVDDIGVAVTAWASSILQTNLFTDQRERARLMVPTLLCFIIGNVVSGPIADWADGRGAAVLARWRWQIVIFARGVETLALASLVLLVAAGPPTVARVLPYMMVSAFLKTALRPTRLAFEVDLLEKVAPQFDQEGRPLLDEHGEQLVYKKHLASFGAMSSALRSFAALGGLLAGGVMIDLVHHQYWPLFLFDVLTNVVFVAIIAVACRPVEVVASVAKATAAVVRAPIVIGFFRSVRDGVRFLFASAQRPLLALLFGAWLVEVVTESYDGKMIVKQVLHGSEDDVRHVLIVWTVVSMIALSALPALVRKVENLGRLFLAIMLIDGLVIACAGRIASVPVASAILPFAAVLGLDQALTLSVTTLIDLAANSASSAGMRGRIAATYAFFVLLGDLGMEMVATEWSESVGIAPMLSQIGLVQVGLVVLVAVLFGRSLWNFGLRTERTPADAQPASATAT
jgi:hypothetical protein